MIRLTGIRLPIDYTDNTIKKKVCKELRIDEKSIHSISLFRRSVDARKKNDVHFTATVDITVNGDENTVISRAKNKKASIAKPYEYDIPRHKPLNTRPVIAGFGPAGMFAGLILAMAGEKPIIIGIKADGNIIIGGGGAPAGQWYTGNIIAITKNSRIQ